jgi:hypothetical protein
MYILIFTTVVLALVFATLFFYNPKKEIKK